MSSPPEQELSASLEDYLEAVFLLVQKNQVARVKDIADHLNVSMSSVTGALRSLSAGNLVNYTPYQVVTLTALGREKAVEIVRRHEVLRDFLVRVLDLDLETADRNACSMEHAVEPVVLEKFLQYAEFLEHCPRAGVEWRKEFRDFCEHGKSLSNCEKCLETCLKKLQEERGREGRREGRPFSLSELEPGEKGMIIQLQGNMRMRRRMVEMGFTRGVFVEVERIAPLGDPIQVKVRGYHLSLRRDEAAKIRVEKF